MSYTLDLDLEFDDDLFAEYMSNIDVGSDLMVAFGESYCTDVSAEPPRDIALNNYNMEENFQNFDDYRDCMIKRVRIHNSSFSPEYAETPSLSKSSCSETTINRRKRGRPRKYLTKKDKREAERHSRYRSKTKEKEKNEKDRQNKIQKSCVCLKRKYTKIFKANIFLYKSCPFINANYTWDEPVDISVYEYQLKKSNNKYKTKCNEFEKRKFTSASKKCRERKKLCQLYAKKDFKIYEKMNRTYQRWIYKINLKNKYMKDVMASLKNTKLNNGWSYYDATLTNVTNNFQSLNTTGSDYVYQQSHVNQPQHQECNPLARNNQNAMQMYSNANQMYAQYYLNHDSTAHQNTIRKITPNNSYKPIEPAQQLYQSLCHCFDASCTNTNVYQNGVQYEQTNVTQIPQTQQECYKQIHSCQSQQKKCSSGNKSDYENHTGSSSNMSDPYIPDHYFDEFDHQQNQRSSYYLIDSTTSDHVPQQCPLCYDYVSSYNGSYCNRNGIQQSNSPYLQHNNTLSIYESKTANENAFTSYVPDSYYSSHDSYDE